ncbi:MAG: hypothetical protein K6D38_10450 [Pseudobutyrivibrio sp.]|nr:hypothetical protein [Pseudobutyrivibrio sp.]
MKRKKHLLIVATAISICAVSVTPAISYFTDTQQATGRLVLEMNPEIEPKEIVENMKKIISVANTGKNDVFVRAKAIYASNFDVVMDKDATDSGWSLNEADGYYYYDKIVKVGEETPQLVLKVDVKDDKAVAYDFNVVIVQEAARVIYDEKGNASCVWDEKIYTSTSESEFEQTITEIPADETNQNTPDNNTQGGGQ